MVLLCRFDPLGGLSGRERAVIEFVDMPVFEMKIGVPD